MPFRKGKVFLSAIKDDELHRWLQEIEKLHPGLIENLKKEVKASLGAHEEADVVILPSFMSYEEKEIYCICYYLNKGLPYEEAEREAKLLLGPESLS